MAPTSDGWWYQLSTAGTALPVLAPDVPPGGLFSEAGPNGPIAVSAVGFAVPAGSMLGPLELSIAGTPAITAPPTACPVTGSFTAVSDGAWAGRPTYDCAHALTGVLDPTQTHVTFAPTQDLVADGELQLVILAAGTADRIAFDAPDPLTLTLTAPAPSAPETQPSTAAPAGTPAAAVGTPRAATVSAPAARTPTANPPVNTAVTPAPPAAVAAGSLPVAPLTASPPAASAPSVVVASAPEQAAAPAGAPAAGGSPVLAADGAPHGRDSTLPTVTGIALLLVVIVYWADGFGAVPLRAAAARLRRGRSGSVF